MQVAETSTTEEELVGETNYRVAEQQQQNLQQQSMYAVDLCDFSYSAMPQQQQQQYMQSSAASMFGAPAYPRTAASVSNNSMINTHNNFISQVGYLVTNNNHKQTIKIPKGYSQIVVYVIANSNSIKREYSLPSAKLSKTSQTHSKLSETADDAGWAICR